MSILIKSVHIYGFLPMEKIPMGPQIMLKIDRYIALLRGEKLNSKSLAKEISKPPFLATEVQWASKFTLFVRFTFPLNVSNHAHIWYVT